MTMGTTGPLPLREASLVRLAMALGRGGGDFVAAVKTALAAGNDLTELMGAATEMDAVDRVLAALAVLGETPPPVSRIAQTSGHDVGFYDTGGPGAPMLILHSMGLDHRAVQHLIPYLHAQRRVIAVDLRGHGLAAATTLFDSLHAAASDLIKMLDHLGIDKIELVGLSMGGLVAQRFAADFPDRLAALALVCTVAKGTPPMHDRAREAERNGLEPLLPATLGRWLGPEAVAANGWGVRYARECLRVMDVPHWAAAWRTMGDADLEAELTAIRVPTKVIAGAADTSASVESMQSVADRIAGARFIVVPDAPHFISLVQPAALARALLS